MEKLLLHVSQQSFAEWAVRQIRQGYGLTPFVGSGLSAPSGILTGQNFTNYITWTVYRCVASIDADDELRGCHDLQRDGWPDLPNQKEVDQAKSWVWREFIKCSAEAGMLVNGLAKADPGTPPDKMEIESLAYEPGRDAIQCELLRPLAPSIIDSAISRKADQRTRALIRSLGREASLRHPLPKHGQFTTTRSYIIETAIRSLYEWRASLDFLARLRVDRSGYDLPLRLDEEADQSVIDRFNITITYGRRPNLAHNMLCHLAGRARIHTVLTTNFDKLIEEAFTELGEHLEVIPVSLRGELPAPATVLAQPSVVKLHGDLLETRADHSLDDPPEQEDLRRFFEYVMGRAPGVKPEEGHIPSLLLVCGYSGSDMRCLQMIQQVLEADPAARVLWVCYNQNDIASVESLFKDYVCRKRLTAAESKEDRAEADADWRTARIIATVTNRCDLLLYEIYQRLTLSLPRGGFNYQFSANVPPGLDEPERPRAAIKKDPAALTADEIKKAEEEQRYKEASEKLGESLRERLKIVFDEPDHLPRRAILCADGESGLLPVLRGVYQYATEDCRKQGMWLWLGDHTSTTSLAHEFLTALALRVGRFQLDHALFGYPKDPKKGYDFWKDRLDRLMEHWNVNPDDWFFVVDGRNGVGSCARWPSANPADERHSPPSEIKTWDAEEYDHLNQFLSALQDARNLQASNKGFHVVYAPFSRRRKGKIVDREMPIEELRKKLEEDAARAKRSYGKIDEAFWRGLREEWEQSREGAVEKPPEPDQRKDDAWPDPHDIEGQLGWERSNLDEPTPPSFIDLLRDISKSLLKPSFEEGQEPGEQTMKPSPVEAEKRRALYGAMLFRQSRHFSAFMSEGVYPCPHRYNAGEQDNDWVRYQHLNAWFKEWNAMPSGGSLFHGKPGGFAWMYRDARLGVRLLINSIQPIPFDSGDSFFQNARQAEARMHYWIGDWYMRAHRATGHAEPLVEAIYHFSKCIFTSEVARPAARPGSNARRDFNINLYRRRYARRALLEMIKALRQGRHEIYFWIQAAAGESWFKVDEKGSWIANKCQAIFENLDAQRFKASRRPKTPARQTLVGKRKLASEWTPWIQELNDELAQLPQLASSQRIVLRRAPVLPTANIDADTPYFVGSFQVLQQPEEWWKWLREKWIAKNYSLKKAGALNKHLTGICAIFQQYSATTKDAAGKAGMESSEFNSKLKAHLVHLSDKARLDPALLYLLIQLLSEISYGTLQCAKRLEKVSPATLSLKRDADVQKLWIEVCALCWTVLDLCVELPPAMYGVDGRLRIKTNTIYGLALGRLGRFFEAHRRFNEAHGWLSKSEARLDPLEAAIIEIRRAEVHLLEAIRLREMLAALEGDLEQGRKYSKFEKFLIRHKVDPKTAEQWRSLYMGSDDAPGHGPAKNELTMYRELQRIHVAKLDDAWTTLASTTRLLTGKTHSSLWWGHLYILKLRLYAEHWWPSPTSDESACHLHRARMFGKRRDHLTVVRQLYRAAQVAGHADLYRRLRLLHYTIGALISVWNHLERESLVNAWSQKQYGDFAKVLKTELEAQDGLIPDENVSVSGNEILKDYHGRIAKLLKQLFDDMEASAQRAARVRSGGSYKAALKD